ncbi:MAG: hypothetical protein A2Z34_08495 [Planctomycetes bacterium RBG_16_59_8]|nr:MAG: hypothetical protein A2Z34_08495 [Planctomycetes bacterium RBG_16_59_8]
MKRGAIALSLAAVAVGGWFFLSPGPATSGPLPTCEAKSGNLRIVVTCEGTFRSKENVTFKPLIETLRDVAIVTILPNGTMVKKGDTLATFDAAELESQASNLEIGVQAAESDLVHTREEVNKAELDKELNIRGKTFALALADKELKKYQELDGPRQLKESEMKLKRTEAELEEARKNLAEAQEMLQQDLIAGSEVKKAELRLLEAEFAFESAKMGDEVLKKFTAPIDLQKVRQTFEDATKQLESIRPYMEALVSQKKAALSRSERNLIELNNQLEKKERDIRNCVMKSPVDGMVVYGAPDRNRWEGGESEWKPGDKVGIGATMMYIPDLSKMHITINVDELEISKMKIGQKVSIRADAHPETLLTGTVEKIGMMGVNRSWWDETVKFDVQCSIDESFDWFRPGLRVRADIFIEELSNVTYLPLDALFEVQEKSVCYMENGSERRVVVGKTTYAHVEIKEGLKPGESVLLVKPAK